MVVLYFSTSSCRDDLLRQLVAAEQWGLVSVLTWGKGAYAGSMSITKLYLGILTSHKYVNSNDKTTIQQRYQKGAACIGQVDQAFQYTLLNAELRKVCTIITLNDNGL